jgi:uroporphyrinogen III methyltransferase / synthase
VSDSLRADWPAPRAGKVYLVGAGPGDPGLITLRGAECLGRADLVLYDYLVNPALLRAAPDAAERVSIGHHRVGRTIPPEAVEQRMIEAARAGRTVVRLKGGDPGIFARAAEEIDALRAAGIDFEVVPGVSAATAAAACADIPLTCPQYASAVALVTGHRSGDSDPAALDYAALAKFPGTLVIYMGTTSAGGWSRALLDGGKPPECPVAIIRRATLPDQKTIRCTLESAASTIAQRRIRPPTVIVVGAVAGLGPAQGWFERRPLFAQTVLVTRPLPASGPGPESAESVAGRVGPMGATGRPDDPLAGGLAELGARVLVQPAIAVADPPDWRPVDDALARIDRYDWLVFSSAHGVRRLLGRLRATGGDARWLGRTKLAAIGPATADALARYALRADLVPAQHRAESLVESLAGVARGRRFLLARASRGREALAEGLRAAGAAAVDQVVVYRSADVEQPDAEIAEALRTGRVDWVAVTSSAIARSLLRLFGDDLRRARLASISPTTSATLRELGHRPAVEAETYTSAGLVGAIRGACGTVHTPP